MREADERKRQKSISSTNEGELNGWELDEESEESAIDEAEDEEDDPDTLDMSDQEYAMPTPAQRALDYISGRQSPGTCESRKLFIFLPDLSRSLRQQLNLNYV